MHKPSQLKGIKRAAMKTDLANLINEAAWKITFAIGLRII
jgi:hypothetical protein